VVVGSGGTIFTSSNGTTWTSRTLDSKTLTGITFENNKFITVGWSETILSSSDNGTTWDNMTLGTSSSELDDVIYVNNKFITVGYPGNIRSSSDGTTWDNINSGILNYLYGVTYGNSTFV
jgi:photosystem II stability/assembly factor-like uncharacterized protein